MYFVNAYAIAIAVGHLEGNLIVVGKVWQGEALIGPRFMVFSSMEQQLPGAAVYTIIDIQGIYISTPVSIDVREVEGGIGGTAQVHDGRDQVGGVASACMGDTGIIVACSGTNGGRRLVEIATVDTPDTTASFRLRAPSCWHGTALEVLAQIDLGRPTTQVVAIVVATPVKRSRGGMR